MLTTSDPFRGSIQAQGKDIKRPKGGHTSSWAQAISLRADEGLARLADIKSRCDSDQVAMRRNAFRKAKRFIETARQMGGVTPEAQPHSFQDRDRDEPTSRVDIEISAGLVFIP
jgi:hypothetical protein